MALRLYLHQPAILFVAQVDLDGLPPVYPQMEVNFKNVTVGNYSLLLPGFTLLFGTAPGKDDLGRNRIRRVEEEFPTFRLQVGRFSQGVGDGEVTLIENSYITLLDDHRVWAKIPRMIGAVIRKDGDMGAFGTVDKPRPVASAGPGVAGDIDASGYFTVTFDGSQSFQLLTSGSPPVGGITSFSYDPKDGLVVSGDLLSDRVTVRFPPGFRYVRLRVTGDNGEQHDTWIPVYARDPANDTSIAAFQVKSHTHTKAGQEITIEFFEPLPRDLYRDGTLMMLWDDALAYVPEFHDARTHMQFIGWHQRDEASIRSERTATLHSTTLTFFDVGKRLSTLPGFPQVQEYNAAPTTWYQTGYPTILYYFWYLLYWHSTALEVAPLELGTAGATLAMYEYVTLGSDRANLYEQVESIAAKITPDHHFVCGRQGQMRIIPDYMIANVSDRPETTMQGLSDADWTEVSYGYERPPRVQQIMTMAIVSGRNYVVVDGEDTIEVIASLAPGEAQGQGGEYLENSERICISQFNLNTTEGNRYARVNARYLPFTITLPFEKLVAGVDLARGQWLRLTVNAANSPEREAVPAFTNQRGLVQEMTIAYDYQLTGLVRTVTLAWELETSGKPAQTLVLWPDTPD